MGSMAHKCKWPLAVVSLLSMQRSYLERLSLRQHWVHLQCQGRARPGDILPGAAATDYAGLDVRRDSGINMGSGEACMSLCGATGQLGGFWSCWVVIDVFLPFRAGVWRISGPCSLDAQAQASLNKAASHVSDSKRDFRETSELWQRHTVTLGFGIGWVQESGRYVNISIHRSIPSASLAGPGRQGYLNLN